MRNGVRAGAPLIAMHCRENVDVSGDSVKSYRGAMKPEAREDMLVGLSFFFFALLVSF